MTDSPAARAREAARRCETAGLTAEADMLYRLAETLENQDRAAASASLARVLLAAGRADPARPYALDGSDPVLVARLLLEDHDFGEARRLLDEARRRDPFDPRIASARGRLGFLEKRFEEAVGDLLEAALLKPDGLPDATDRRFLRAARALAPERIPAWKEAVAGARDRLAREAAERAPGVPWPDRSAELLRSLIRRSGLASEGVLDRARRLAELPSLRGLDEGSLFWAAAAGDLRRLARGSVLYRAGEPAGEISLVLQGTLSPRADDARRRPADGRGRHRRLRRRGGARRRAPHERRARDGADDAPRLPGGRVLRRSRAGGLAAPPAPAPRPPPLEPRRSLPPFLPRRRTSGALARPGRGVTLRRDAPR